MDQQQLLQVGKLKERKQVFTYMSNCLKKFIKHLPSEKKKKKSLRSAMNTVCQVQYLNSIAEHTGKKNNT